MNTILQTTSHMAHLNLFQNASVILKLRGCRRITQLAFISLSVTILAACGGTRTVVTQDDSANYSAAKILPALRKPNSNASEPIIANSLTTQSYVIQKSSAVSTAADNRNRVPTAEVVNSKGGTSKLVVKAERSLAWEYLREQLKSSDITVHSRNRSAGIVQIGCAGIDDSVAKVKKQTGWRIKASKDDSPIYCVLKADDDKNKTRISVLDRKGKEVSGDIARAVFARLSL